MATTTTELSKPRRVCFSFAAYAKNLINHLRKSNIPVADGLTEAEFSTIESNFNFTFLPDLRSILEEGLPVGPGFPNWRYSSNQQLQILINLPILGICREVSKNNFWAGTWGTRPDNPDEAANLALQFLNESPALVPIYGRFYIPCRPFLAGNPVFEVNGSDVAICGFDIAGFFQRAEFGFHAPPWAALEARRVEFWSEMAGRDETLGCCGGVLRGCFDEVCCRLREGGWDEKEVREMMLMDGGDDTKRSRDNYVLRDKEGVAWHVWMCSLRLLRAGWSTEDVVDSLGLPDIDRNGGLDMGSWFDNKQSKGGCEDILV
ncbi:hypothetical protein LguiB_033288 [Lonicera macranthoides]